MKKNILLIIAALFTLTFPSCKKDAAEPQKSGTGTFYFHLHTYAGGVEVQNYDSIYTMSGSRKITVSAAQLYISNIQLIRLDGSSVDLTGAILLKKQETEEHNLGTVPAGNYRSVRFSVGLPPALNGSVPAAGDNDLNQPSMWFSATAQPDGFVFVNFQGTIDTTIAANGAVAAMQPFSYKIGTNAHFVTVTMPDQNYTVAPGQTQSLHIAIDFEKLFDGVQLNNASNLMMNSIAANGSSLGTQLAGNISSMFSYE